MSVELRLREGGSRLLAIDGWYAPADDTDRAACADVRGPVLDVGCGPGRMVVALAARGLATLGVDASPAAVASAVRRGAPTLCRSVYDHVPGEGRWGAVLLFDGNIGIGGDPAMLLTRVAQLLAPDGTAVVELDAPGQPTGSTMAQLVHGDEQTRWFPWATVAVDEIARFAMPAGLRVRSTEPHGQRWFATLARRSR